MPLDQKAKDEIKAIVGELVKPLMDGLVALSRQVTVAQEEYELEEPEHGLCGDTGCATCVHQAQTLSQAAFDRGHNEALDELDGLLKAAGGEALQLKMAQAVEMGRIIKHGLQVVA